jgi:hypothetical protein
MRVQGGRYSRVPPTDKQQAAAPCRNDNASIKSPRSSWHTGRTVTWHDDDLARHPTSGASVTGSPAALTGRLSPIRWWQNSHGVLKH